MIELHTGCFANTRGPERAAEVARLSTAARLGQAAGLRVNAGHGITLANLPDLFSVPHLAELNIGHSIVSRAVFIGLTAAVAEMRAAMNAYRG
jgi:pyridoxine 5-phosphate synthase